MWYCFVDCYGCWVGDLVIWNWFGWLLCFCLCFCLCAGCGPCIGCFSCSLVMFAGVDWFRYFLLVMFDCGWFSIVGVVGVVFRVFVL